MPQISNSYSKDINRFPTMNDNERQVELALQAQAGNNDARDELVTSLLRYIRKVATVIFNEDSEYAENTSDKTGNKLEVDDLINEGVEGLIKAIAGFDRSKGSNFMKYAGSYINGTIRDALNNYRHICNNEKELPADDDKNREEKHPAQDANTEESVLAASLKEKLNSILATLPPDEAKVLRLFFDFDSNEKNSPEEIAKQCNLTVQQVQNLAERGIDRMRHSPQIQQLKEYRE